MPQKILLITPPFTQLNTPYPATPALTGFLKQRGYQVVQADLGIELINRIFSSEGFTGLFSEVKSSKRKLTQNSLRILRNERHYLETVDHVMSFLQYRDDTAARLLSSDDFLPRASRFDQLPDLEWSFGNIGQNDRARFLATLYIEDMGDLIKDAVTPFFGFSRYAEKLGRAARSFSPLDDALRQPENLIEQWMLELLKRQVEAASPSVAGFTVPFPGNLYAALKCGQWFRKHHPRTRTIAGGGYVNTELRSLSDPAVFDYLDYITLDDGELPFLRILQVLDGERSSGSFTRTFVAVDKSVRYIDGGEKDISPSETGCPDYTGLPLDRYLSLIEIANPMHRLWSDGRWNKLVLAHGCYWHKCSFCDASLDYIKRCASAPAEVLADRIEQISRQTGRTGFHFADEAAPPNLLKSLALELLKRKIRISWWANIRFEQAFTKDLCRLLAASGCIAVTGGLETASDRLLILMNKGITVRQAARVCANFRDAGVMVHAYLMYGFPTQTEQETIDSLEIVRQFFEQGLIQSAFWHLFTATVHSDVGRNPGKYKCRILDLPEGGFAKNDLVHEDPTGCDHSSFAPGLRKAVYNFMHGIGMDFSIGEWFGFRVPRVSVTRNYVEQSISRKQGPDEAGKNAKILWLGNLPEAEPVKKGKREGKILVFQNKTDHFTLAPAPAVGEWLEHIFPEFLPGAGEVMTLEDVQKDYEKKLSLPFDSLLRSPEWKLLRRKGLLLL